MVWCARVSHWAKMSSQFPIGIFYTSKISLNNITGLVLSKEKWIYVLQLSIHQSFQEKILIGINGLIIAQCEFVSEKSEDSL